MCQGLGLLGIELTGELFARPLAERLFDKRAGLSAAAAGKPLRLDTGAAVGGDGDLNALHGVLTCDLDGELDRTVAERLLGDGVTAAAGFEPGPLDGIGLEELVEPGRVAPVSAVVVVTDLAGGCVADDRIAPVGQLDRQAGDGPAVQPVLARNGGRPAAI